MDLTDRHIGKNIEVFDSTLRDGAQGEGITFSVEDKLNIVKALDYVGADYIEAGNPSSNPKDLEFFKEIDLGLVGEVIGVKTDVLEMFTQSDFIPVIAPIPFI